MKISDLALHWYDEKVEMRRGLVKAKCYDLSSARAQRVENSTYENALNEQRIKREMEEQAQALRETFRVVENKEQQHD